MIAQSALYFTPWQTCSIDHYPAISAGSIKPYTDTLFTYCIINYEKINSLHLIVVLISCEVTPRRRDIIVRVLLLTLVGMSNVLTR